MCIYTYVYIYIYTLVFKSVANFICIKFIDLFLNFWTGVYIYMCVCVYIYIYIHIYIYTHIYTYTCIYIHIHIHLCIYLHILTFPTREIQWYSAYSFLTRVSKKASQGQRQLSSLGTPTSSSRSRLSWSFLREDEKGPRERGSKRAR